jgi:hypothetical protein
MEFLMTYGWAILVVLVVIGALAYFGILKPETSLPDRCELQQGFYCKDFRILDAAAADVDTISFTFQNGRGTSMMVERVQVIGTGDVSQITCTTGDTLLSETWSNKFGRYIENGASTNLAVPCGANALDDLVGSGKKKFNIVITWFDATSTPEFAHTMNGQLLANVEAPQ